SRKDCRDVIYYFLVGDRLSASFAVKRRNRNTPHTLPRHTPVGTALDHVSNSIAAPGRHPVDTLFDFTQRALAQTSAFRSAIHRDEPLRRRSEDHWVMTSPAVRITMRILLREDQHALRSEELDYLRICIEHRESGEVLDFLSE